MNFDEALNELEGADIPRFHTDLLDDKILHIFGGRCVVCWRRTIVVHEIVPKSHGKKYLAANNRVPVCEYHHQWAHENTSASIGRLAELRVKALENRGIVA